MKNLKGLSLKMVVISTLLATTFIFSQTDSTSHIQNINSYTFSIDSLGHIISQKKNYNKQAKKIIDSLNKHTLYIVVEKGISKFNGESVFKYDINGNISELNLFNNIGVFNTKIHLVHKIDSYFNKRAIQNIRKSLEFEENKKDSAIINYIIDYQGIALNDYELTQKNTVRFDGTLNSYYSLYSIIKKCQLVFISDGEKDTNHNLVFKGFNPF